MMLHNSDRGVVLSITDIYHWLLVHGNTLIIGQIKYILAVEITLSTLSFLRGRSVAIFSSAPTPRLQGTVVTMSRSLCLAMPARPCPSINFIFPRAVNTDPPLAHMIDYRLVDCVQAI